LEPREDAVGDLGSGEHIIGAASRHDRLQAIAAS
jgi:hypothetical protein